MKERYYSLDVFRGATVALMIMVNNPGSWDHIFAPLEHAPWNGCTPTDLVFPFFLFAVGNAMSFVMPGFMQAGNRVFLKKVIKRAVLIFLIGLFLNWSPFIKWDNDQLIFKVWERVRILGVLQRIAICYLLAALIIYYGKTRGAFVISIVLLMGYWLLCIAFGHPPDVYSMEGYFGVGMDKAILGESHMYHGEGVAFDPEGISSNITAIVQVIFGYFVGQYIQLKGKNYEMLSNLFVIAGVLLFAGYCWDMLFPINKKIWTSSYVLYTTGMAVFILSILIFLLEFKNAKGAWSRFFDVFGKNPLFIFVLSGLLPRLLGLIRINNGLNADGAISYTSPFGWFYDHICKPMFSNLNTGSLFYALCMIAFYWLIVYVLDKRKIYIKV